MELAESNKTIPSTVTGIAILDLMFIYAMSALKLFRVNAASCSTPRLRNRSKHYVARVAAQRRASAEPSEKHPSFDARNHLEKHAIEASAASVC